MQIIRSSKKEKKETSIMTRNKSGCCGGSGGHNHGSSSSGHSHGSSSGCKSCGSSSNTSSSGTQFKFSGRTNPGTSVPLTNTGYLADAGVETFAQTVPQLYPLALEQDISTLAVNLRDPVPAGTNLVVEVLGNGVPLPTPLRVVYAAGESGHKFAVLAEPQTFNGADATPPSTLDVAVTTTVTTFPGALAPLRISAVVG